jgi:perosamine synthetase
MNSDDNKYMAESIINAIESVIGPPPVKLHEPLFQGNEWLYLKDCLDSNYVSSVGKFVEKFEKSIANYTGAKYAVAMVNGTSALHIALLIANVKPKDEVLVPALTFIATANAITYCGAIPHFIDSESTTFGIDPLKLLIYLKNIAKVQNGLCINKNSGRVIKALIPMHVFGHPSNLRALIDISNEFNIELIEDAAESLGSLYGGRHVGTFGKIGVLSFNGNKIITTGGGGAILTNNAEIAFKAKHLSTTAKTSHLWEYDHDSVGYNYRMPNINAALGCAQIENISTLLELKRKLTQNYSNAFNDVDGCKLKLEPENCKSNYWLQTIVLNASNMELRNEILRKINYHGYMARPVWNLLNRINHFKKFPMMDLSGAEDLEKRIINIPSSSIIAND